MFRDSVEITAASVQAATALGLEVLGVEDASGVDVVVLEEGVREGQFTWNARPARVRVTRRVEGFGFVARNYPDSIPAPVEDGPVRSAPPGPGGDTFRSRRSSRKTRVMPRPTLVLGEEAVPAAEAPVSAMGIEPSRARERAAYAPTDADNQAVEEVTADVMDAAGLEYTATYEPGDYQRVHLALPPRRAGVLIGRRGAVLDALEHLLGRMASQRVGHLVPVQVDVNEYRARHEQEIREEALQIADQVQESGKDWHFAPMRPRDRRVIHLAVKPIEGLETYTLGEGSNRHVVIVREE